MCFWGFWLLVTSAHVVVWPPRARCCVLVCAPFGTEGGHMSGSTRSNGTRVYVSWRAAYGPAIVPWCLSSGPVCGRPRGVAGGGSRSGPGAWVAAGGQDGGDAKWARGPLAAAGRRGRAAWCSAASLSAAHCGVDGRAGGQCDVQVLLGARTTGLTLVNPVFFCLRKTKEQMRYPISKENERRMQNFFKVQTPKLSMKSPTQDQQRSNTRKRLRRVSVKRP